MHTVGFDGFMQEREDARENVVREGHGIGEGSCEGTGAVVKVAVEESVGVPGESLAPQAFLEPPRPQPHPIQHRPRPRRHTQDSQCHPNLLPARSLHFQHHRRHHCPALTYKKKTQQGEEEEDGGGGGLLYRL